MKLFRTFKTRRKISNVSDPAERYVALQLENSFSAKEYGIFHNVLIPSNNHVGTSQIDHLIVSVYGIFCIETKKHKGLILGIRVKRIFKQILYRNHYDIVPNPVYQNQSHIKALRELLGPRLKAPIVNIVVFPYASKFTIDGYENVGSVEDLYDIIHGSRSKVYTFHEAEEIINRINKSNMRYPEAHVYHARAVSAIHAH